MAERLPINPRIIPLTCRERKQWVKNVVRQRDDDDDDEWRGRYKNRPFRMSFRGYKR